MFVRSRIFLKMDICMRLVFASDGRRKLESDRKSLMAVLFCVCVIFFLDGVVCLSVVGVEFFQWRHGLSVFLLSISFHETEENRIFILGSTGLSYVS